MKDQFVPFELAVKLKELGFDEGCFGNYELIPTGSDSSDIVLNLDTPCMNPVMILCKAPMWGHAFDYLREKYNFETSITGSIFINKEYFFHILNNRTDYNFSNEDYYKTYEEARQACLEKLIEILGENKQYENR